MIGHLTKDCKENRKFDTDAIPDMSAEDAWVEMKKASDEQDLDEFRKVSREDTPDDWNRLITHTHKAFQIYSKATPDATLVDIELKMREENFNIWTCALVRLS